MSDYRVSQTCGELTLNIGDGVPSSGTISFDNLRNKFELKLKLKLNIEKK